jgi:hypothetical protein
VNDSGDARPNLAHRVHATRSISDFGGLRRSAEEALDARMMQWKPQTGRDGSRACRSSRLAVAICAPLIYGSVVLLAMFAAAAAAQATTPQDTSPDNDQIAAGETASEAKCSSSYIRLRADDEHLPRPSCRASFQPLIQRYDEPAGWVTADPTVLRDSTKQTIIYVHGNRMTHYEAVLRGWEMYAALRRDQHDRPLRLIVWSWPSEQIKGQIRDVRFKAELADEEGYYLATWLGEHPHGEGMGLIGYSYGARVIGSSLHLLGGGAVAGVPALDQSSFRDDPLMVRAVLIAPAMDCDAFADGFEFGAATSHAEHVLVMYNPCDPILRYYRFLDRCRRKDAMGASGAILVPDPRRTFAQIDVAPMIGRSHDLNDYIDHDSLMASVRQSLFKPPAPTVHTPQSVAADPPPVPRTQR